MDDNGREFFVGWESKAIGLRVDNISSTWVLDEKLAELYHQHTAYEHHLRPRVAAAYGTFSCHELNDPSCEAIIKVFMHSAPKLLHVKKDEQDHTGPVPGGLLLYLLIQRPPGKYLNQEIFWSMDRQGRNMVRVAFKQAWLDCVGAGFKPAMSATENLIWDDDNSKM
ncbi:hypothetical protein BDV27DRAFT_146134 [Aspergillus caelatus]|uniref:Uncharacterized protein n=1 Tax=Aspergillus caelatus TaxID=61420 RepID=A0A5N7A0N4_9EURO|nr:uncharacterized protein BDV27DRAFT_146134 [Aspergillus caelatus]KAE8363417.1 hypothetical protein BDV27DRAFT_146134 [Aspergillus caelatus]